MPDSGFAQIWDFILRNGTLIRFGSGKRTTNGLAPAVQQDVDTSVPGIFMSSTKPPVSMPEFSPLSIARMLWKHRLMVPIVAIRRAQFWLSSSFTSLPSIYRSEALILVDSQKIPERYVSSTGNTEVQERLASISQEILSTTRLQKIIDDFGLYREERKKLVQEEIIELMRKDISITLENGGTQDRPAAFRVGYQGQNPTLVTEVASQLANLFIEENLADARTSSGGNRGFHR